MMKVRIKNFSADYDKGCLMIDVIDPMHEFILSQIDPEDIYEPGDPTHGLETRSHVTVAYGFTKQDYPLDVLTCAYEYDETKIRVPKIEFEKISFFDCEEYDVLKWDVNSPDLVNANSKIKALYDLENDYSEYKPHCTLAYLKKGTAAKYVDRFKLIHNIMVKPIQLAFSNAGEEEDYVHVYESI